MLGSPAITTKLRMSVCATNSSHFKRRAFHYWVMQVHAAISKNICFNGKKKKPLNLALLEFWYKPTDWGMVSMALKKQRAKQTTPVKCAGNRSIRLNVKEHYAIHVFNWFYSFSSLKKIEDDESNTLCSKSLLMSKFCNDYIKLRFLLRSVSSHGLN